MSDTYDSRRGPPTWPVDQRGVLDMIGKAKAAPHQQPRQASMRFSEDWRGAGRGRQAPSPYPVPQTFPNGRVAEETIGRKLGWERQRSPGTEFAASTRYGKTPGEQVTSWYRQGPQHAFGVKYQEVEQDPKAAVTYHVHPNAFTSAETA